MNIENYSTNSFTFVAGYPDGSSQSLTLPPGASVLVTSATYGGSTYSDSYDTNYVCVNDSSSGFVAHVVANPTAIFLNGFFDIAPLTAVVVCVLFIRRAFSVKTKGYSTE